MHGEISAEGGGLGMFRGVAKLGGGAWADRLRYTAGVTHLNVTSGVDGYDPYRNSSAQGAASITLSPKSTLGVRLFANDSFVALNTVPYALGALPATGNVAAIEGRTFVTSLNDPDARRSSHFLSTLVNWNYQASDKAAIRANYQGMTTRRDNRDGPGGPRFQPLFNNSNRFDGRIDTAQVRTDLTLPKRNFLTAGYEFERETYDNQSADENPNVSARTFARVRVNQASHSAFIQDQWRMLRDRLQFSLSGRWQHFLLSRPGFVGGAPRYASVVLAAPPDAFTGDAAVSYFLPSSGTKLRAHTGNSYRAPTLYERFGYSFFAGSFSPYGDPLIAPERALAVDAGIDQYLLRSRVRVSATYFYTRLQQVIGFDSSGLINLRTDPYGRSLGYRNTGGGLARGVETSVEAHPASRTRLQAAYTYTKAIERNSTLIGGSVKSIRISPHMFTALASQRIYKGLEVTADLFAASHYVFPFFAGGSRPFDFAGPVKLDVAARYNHPFAEHREMEIYLRIENALNRVYYEDGFRTPKAWAVGGVKFRF
jgi:iron complex outermembrane receptor protein